MDTGIPVAAGCALGHLDIGDHDLPVLVLGGALGSDLGMWREVFTLLARRVRIVYFDLPGHGRSSMPTAAYSGSALAADILRSLTSCGVESFSYFGISLSSCVGFELALAAPDRVRRLVVASAAIQGPEGDWSRRAAAVLEAGSTSGMADEVLKRWVTPNFAANHPERLMQLRRMLAATSPEGYALGCRLTASMDLRSALPRIHVPTLIISGENDPATPATTQAAIAAALPDAQQAVVGPAGHLVVVEQPELVAELLLEHVLR